MASFLGGSAFAMARGIADGFHLVTERTFKGLTPGDIAALSQELDVALRDARSEQPPLDDLTAVKARNRKIQRLNTAFMILRSFQQRTAKR